MGCACHGKKGEATVKMRPDDQCTMCAYKHVKSAWSAYGEFTYEDDNRDYVSGQLRLAIEHLKYSHRDFALELRDIAVALEKAEDAGALSDRLYKALAASRDLFRQDHPEVAERLETLRNGGRTTESMAEQGREAAGQR